MSKATESGELAEFAPSEQVARKATVVCAEKPAWLTALEPHLREVFGELEDSEAIDAAVAKLQGLK